MIILVFEEISGSCALTNEIDVFIAFAPGSFRYFVLLSLHRNERQLTKLTHRKNARYKEREPFGISFVKSDQMQLKSYQLTSVVIS